MNPFAVCSRCSRRKWSFWHTVYHKFLVGFLVFFLHSTNCFAENYPEIIPEDLQILAREFRVAEQLGIDWENAELGDVGRYIGFLASVNLISQSIASQFERESPETEDYLAALGVACGWPPFKPVRLDEYQDLLYPAFYNASLKSTIPSAIGPMASDLSKSIGEIMPTRDSYDILMLFDWETSELMSFDWPTSEEEHFSELLDFHSLDGR